MADRYTSKIALVLDRPSPPVSDLVASAGTAGDIDRGAPVGDDGAAAMEVHWGGRMQRAVVRATEGDDGAPLLRTEAYIGDQGVAEGMRRQLTLLQALVRQLDATTAVAVRDQEALTEHDLRWLNRAVVAGVDRADAIDAKVDGEGTRWVHTHGAARFDVPDLELYGLSRAQVEPGVAELDHVHDQLLERGLKTDLQLRDGTPVYLVPVLDAWPEMELSWPGVGRAGQDRGPGLDGPRATLSLLHPPRLGRFRTDFKGLRKALTP